MSKIEWTQRTWNPVVGCSKVSPGCKNCYAIRESHRLAGNPNPKVSEKFKGLTTPDGKNWARDECGEPGTKIKFWTPALDLPLRTRKPTMFFVNSLSDLFHEGLSDAEIDRVFAVMAVRRCHIFQILTKRPQRMLDYFSNCNVEARLMDAVAELLGKESTPDFWGDDLAILSQREPWVPLPNVWLGVSVENQAAADERIPLLLQTPAAVRFLSCEPLLGPVEDIQKWTAEGYECWDCKARFSWHQDKERCTECGHEWSTSGPVPEFCPNCDSGSSPEFVCPECDGLIGQGHPDTPSIDWVIAGGESGKGARPLHPQWVRSLRDQCAAARVPFFFKQWGAWAPIDRWEPWQKKPMVAIKLDGTEVDNDVVPQDVGGHRMIRTGKKKAGRELDGRTHDEFPEALEQWKQELRKRMEKAHG